MNLNRRLCRVGMHSLSGFTQTLIHFPVEKKKQVKTQRPDAAAGYAVKFPIFISIARVCALPPQCLCYPWGGCAFSNEQSQGFGLCKVRGIIFSKMMAAESFILILNMGNKLGFSQNMQLEAQKKVGGKEKHRNCVGWEENFTSVAWSGCVLDKTFSLCLSFSLSQERPARKGKSVANCRWRLMGQGQLRVVFPLSWRPRLWFSVTEKHFEDTENYSR